MNSSIESPTERATPRDWEQIREGYIRGEGSLCRLAKRHGLPLSTVEARCRREGWVQLRKSRIQASLEQVVGNSHGIATVGDVGNHDWWEKQDREHVQLNLEVTRRLRQAVDRKIADATPIELERLGGALQAVVSAERLLLELTPRTAKNKAPSLRPKRSEFWRDEAYAPRRISQPIEPDPGPPST